MILKDKQPHIPWNLFKVSIKEILSSAENLDNKEIQILLDQIN